MLTEEEIAYLENELFDIRAKIASAEGELNTTQGKLRDDQTTLDNANKSLASEEEILNKLLNKKSIFKSIIKRKAISILKAMAVIFFTMFGLSILAVKYQVLLSLLETLLAALTLSILGGGILTVFHALGFFGETKFFRSYNKEDVKTKIAELQDVISLKNSAISKEKEKEASLKQTLENSLNLLPIKEKELEQALINDERADKETLKALRDWAAVLQNAIAVTPDDTQTCKPNRTDFMDILIAGAKKINVFCSTTPDANQQQLALTPTDGETH